MSNSKSRRNLEVMFAALILLFAFLSLFGLIYIAISNYMLRRFRNIKSSNILSKSFIVAHAIVWIILTVSLLNVSLILNWIPIFILSSLKQWHKDACKMISMFFQFCLCMVISWFIVICAIIHVLTRYQIEMVSTKKKIPKRNEIRNKLEKYSQIGIIGSVLTSIVLTIIPIIGNAYGFTERYLSSSENDQHNNTSVFECWIDSYAYRYCFYSLLCFFFFYALFVLILYFYKMPVTQSRRLRFISILNKFTQFVIVTLIGFIPYMIGMIYEISIKHFKNKDNSNSNSNHIQILLPWWLLFVQNIALSVIGLCHTLIWLRAHLFSSAYENSVITRVLNSEMTSKKTSAQYVISQSMELDIDSELGLMAIEIETTSSNNSAKQSNTEMMNLVFQNQFLFKSEPIAAKHPHVVPAMTVHKENTDHDRKSDESDEFDEFDEFDESDESNESDIEVEVEIDDTDPLLISANKQYKPPNLHNLLPPTHNRTQFQSVASDSFISVATIPSVLDSQT